MVEHCMAVFKKEIEELKFRSYIADGIKAIAANTARAVPEGTIMRSRYIDMVDFISARREPEKTGDEIVAEIIQRAGLRIKEQ